MLLEERTRQMERMGISFNPKQGKGDNELVKTSSSIRLNTVLPSLVNLNEGTAFNYYAEKKRKYGGAPINEISNRSLDV